MNDGVQIWNFQGISGQSDFPPGNKISAINFCKNLVLKSPKLCFCLAYDEQTFNCLFFSKGMTPISITTKALPRITVSWSEFKMMKSKKGKLDLNKKVNSLDIFNRELFS
jgi:hypothetical protein